MGCFSTCFGNKKHHHHRIHRSRRYRPARTNPSLLEHLQNYQSVDDLKLTQIVEDVNRENNPTDPSVDLIEEKREKANVSERKKVTFDLNVKVYEDIPREEEDEEEELELVKGKQKKEDQSASEEDSSSSSLFSYPLNHRYGDCRDSDDEFDDILSSDESENDEYSDEEGEEEEDYDEAESKSEVKNGKQVFVVEDQTSESLFSLSLDSKKHNFGADVGGDKEVNSPMPNNNKQLVPSVSELDRNARFDRSKYVDSVLNPVENVAQWKVIKANSRQAARKNQPNDQECKENSETAAQDFDFPVPKEVRSAGKEIAVDTSLSGWLVGSGAGATPNSKSSSASVGNSESDRTRSTSVSPNKFEDRPILGALTVEEIRQFSASNSPRRSPSKSPDDMPIIGTVGSYWSHTGQTTNSGSSTKSRSRFSESTEVIWDSTPFETRLEKALERESSVEQVV